MSALVSPVTVSSVKGRRASSTPAITIPPDRRILRLPAVEDVTGIKKTKIYDEIKQGRFPQPVRLGTRSVGWLADEVQLWITQRAAERS